MMFYLIYSIMGSGRLPVNDISFSEFLTSVQDGRLKGVDVEIRNETEFAWSEDGVRVRSIGKLTDDVMEHMRKNDISFRLLNDDGGGIWQSLLLTWLPLVIVFLFLFFLMRQLQSGGGKAMSFGKSRARLVTEEGPKVTFENVAGADEAKEDLEEIIDFLKDPKKFTRLGGRIPKGVLLVGPPGTGKTLLARAVAGEAGVPFFSISGSDFVEMFVGVGASRVRDLFEQSKKQAPCIIFIDEIDAVGRHRGAGLGGGHDEREQTLNQLLVEMDGFESNEGVILIAATNRPDVLDPALLRPGRFDRRVIVSLPDIGGRGAILQVHTDKVPLDESVELDLIARGTPGFSGADLSNLVNEAALNAAKTEKKVVGQVDFELAKDKVMMGSERRSMIFSRSELVHTAYHEAGHTLVAWLVEESDPVHKVTIIPRGRALGLTQMLPEQDRHSISMTQMLDQLAVLFGGRVAEEFQFGELSTGAGNDIERATDLTRKMVCSWGMSEKLGPLTFGRKEESLFLGRDFQQHQEHSQETANEIDAEIRRIITQQYNRAKTLIDNESDALARIADALVEYETLGREDIETLMKGEELTRDPPLVRLTTKEDIEARIKAKEEDAKKQQAAAAKDGGDDSTSPDDSDGPDGTKSGGEDEDDERLLGPLAGGVKA